MSHSWQLRRRHEQMGRLQVNEEGRRLRVLWVIKGLARGGAETLLAAQAEFYDSRRLTIECAYVLPEARDLVPALESQGIRTICLGGAGWWPLNLRRLIRTGRYDVIHVHSPLPGSVARLAAWSLGGRRPRLVTTEHNAWTAYRRPTRYLNSATANLADSVITVSEEAMRSLRSRVRPRAQHLVHGIDVRGLQQRMGDGSAIRDEFGISPSEILVVTIANFSPQKDYPNLLSAVKLVSRSGVPIKFVAVGHGADEDATRALATEMGLETSVIFTGFRPDAVEILAAADIFVLASAWEGLPVALMEAYAVGAPIVATAVGGVAETVSHGADGVLVPPGDPGALAEMIVRLASQTELRAALKAAALARAADFDVRRSQSCIEIGYRSLLTSTDTHR